MAAQKGLELLLKVDTTGAGAFGTMAGVQSSSIAFNSETVDVTSQDDTSRFRQLLPGAGVRSATMSGSGVFKDDAAFTTVNTYWLNGTIRDWQVTVPDFGTYEGLFEITNLEITGEQNGEVQFSITLESAGDLTFAAA